MDDAETLPSQVARRAPEYAPYNFGANGYGPQNMYLQLKDDGMMSAVVQKEGVIVYVFINEHLPRALGVPNVTVALPYVSLENGQLAFNGTVKSNHRFYLWAEELSSGTKLWPVLSETMSHWNERDALPLVAKILIESKRLAERRFPSVRFCVLIYPHQDKGTLLMPLLEGSGMRILDYSAMSLEDRSFWFVDAHPTAQNYAQVAQALVRDLNLQDRN